MDRLDFSWQLATTLREGKAHVAPPSSVGRQAAAGVTGKPRVFIQSCFTLSNVFNNKTLTGQMVLSCPEASMALLARD